MAYYNPYITGSLQQITRVLVCGRCMDSCPFSRAPKNRWLGTQRYCKENAKFYRVNSECHRLPKYEWKSVHFSELHERPLSAFRRTVCIFWDALDSISHISRKIFECRRWNNRRTRVWSLLRWENAAFTWQFLKETWHGFWMSPFWISFDFDIFGFLGRRLTNTRWGSLISG